MATAFSQAQMNASKLKVLEHGIVAKAGGSKDLFIRSMFVNFDRIATLTGQALAAGDSFPLLPVYAKELIINASVDIITAATGAADIDLGFTGGDVDGLADGIEADDTEFTVKAARGVLLPLYIVSNDTCDILESGGASLAGCEVRVWALIGRF